MIVGVVSGLLFGRTGYYLLLSWCCVTIFFFMVRAGGGCGCVGTWPGGRRLGLEDLGAPGGGWAQLTLAPQIRTLRLKILSEAAAEGVLVRGAKNQLRMYLTMAIAALQPVFMYWLTYHLVW